MKNENENLKKEKSCGCIVIKNNKVLLIKQVTGIWGFPKGHVEKDETEYETALREVKEETNLDVKIISDKRYTMSYLTERGSYKQVVLFVANEIRGKIKRQEAEIDDIKWLNYEDALEIINFQNTKDILKEVSEDNYINSSY